MAQQARFFAGVLALLALVPDTAWAELSGESTERQASSAPGELTLASGLRVGWAKIPGDEVSVCSTARLGTLDEEHPGVALVLAEVLREGGYRSPSTDYAELLRTRGGRTLVEVGANETTSCVTAPARELPLLLWASAGRFSRNALTESEVKAAKRKLDAALKTEDADGRGARVEARVRGLAFLGSDALRRANGGAADVVDVSLEEVARLHAKTFHAEGVSISIAGNFSEPTLRRLVEEHFSQVRSGTRTERIVPPRLVQSTERYGFLETTEGSGFEARFAWVRPSSEGRAMDLGLVVLRQRLAKKAHLSSDRLELRLGDDAPGEISELRVKGRTLPELEEARRAFDEVTRELGALGPTPEELKIAAEFLRESEATRLRAPEALAARLGATLLREGSLSAPGAPNREEGTKAADVALAARELLAPRRRSLIEIVPKGFDDPYQVQGPETHVSERGETLGTLAFRYGTTVPEILRLNGRSSVFSVVPGEKLKVPRGKEKTKAPVKYVVRSGDTLTTIAKQFDVSIDELGRVNQLRTEEKLAIGQILFVAHSLPHEGEVLPEKTAVAEPHVERPTAAPASPEKSSPSTTPEKVASDVREPAEGNEQERAALPAGPGKETEREEAPAESSPKASPKNVPTETPPAVSGAPHQKLTVVAPSSEKKPTARNEGKPVGTPGAAASKKSGARGAKSEAKPATEYVVVSGDHLTGLARKFHTSVRELAEMNGLKKDAGLWIGQKLKVPSAKAERSGQK